MDNPHIFHENGRNMAIDRYNFLNIVIRAVFFSKFKPNFGRLFAIIYHFSNIIFTHCQKLKQIIIKFFKIAILSTTLHKRFPKMEKPAIKSEFRINWKTNLMPWGQPSILMSNVNEYHEKDLKIKKQWIFQVKIWCD